MFQVVFPVYCFLLDVVLVVLSLFLNLCYLIEIPSFWHIKVSLSPGVSFLIVYSVLEIFPSVPIQIPCGFYYRGFVCVLVIWQGKSFIFFNITFLVYFQIFNISYVLWNFFFQLKEPCKVSNWNCIKFIFGRINHCVHMSSHLQRSYFMPLYRILTFLHWVPCTFLVKLTLSVTVFWCECFCRRSVHHSGYAHKLLIAWGWTPRFHDLLSSSHSLKRKQNWSQKFD